MAETRKKFSFPNKDELVVATITKVQNYGAFGRLEEYQNCEGMIHISEISNRWIKNIGDFVKDGDRVVVKVLRVDAEKGHVDLSLKSVKEAQRKEVLDLFKKEQRARKLIEQAAKKLKADKEVDEVIESIYANSDSVFDVLQNATVEGDKVFEEIKISDEWKKTLVKLAKDNIEAPRVEIKATLEMESRASNGVEIVRTALTGVKKKKLPKDVELKLKYLGAPKYRLELGAPNYKIAEQVLDGITKDLNSAIQKGQGSVKITR
ncbi:TPA: translation initiation factor IF-2 subunit alpha [archaeon]|nr:translation initiation factor IF-2 subunit alpha [Candidatus Naiadarchaeales archaeon SRR2090153.bin461]HIK02473.1 translation initiation factor IF-2 subunit alpha [Candidatus Naiadarchaeales archaeon SRR2090159.bin1288]